MPGVRIAARLERFNRTSYINDGTSRIAIAVNNQCIIGRVSSSDIRTPWAVSPVTYNDDDEYKSTPAIDLYRL